ncbi:MAG TPA: tRNA pseudouridine(13) synthase TruD [Kofleriaceae bacterium]|nr:tRNA pseudouridine(13) synthase TruD [Kofleriaceae bacterium]
MSPPTLDQPLLTDDLPGTGGVLRSSPGDFRVIERPAYDAAGEGDHVFATIEKTGLTTFEAIKRIAAALGVAPRDVGSAGMKDRHAITEQRLSLPAPCSPEQVLALELEGIRVLEARRHGHKLRTGHLRGNAFVITIRDTEVDGAEAAARARQILRALTTAPGSPNWYGEQRFGARGDNAAVGRALLLRAPLPAGVRAPRGQTRRLMISAYQSQLFNQALHQRMADGLYRRVIEGDLLQKTDTGGIFASEDPAGDQGRLDRGEVVPTGPMFGHRMKAPPAGSAAGAREAAILAAEGLTEPDFARAGKLASGTRRAYAIALGETDARAIEDRAIEVSFELPAGAYATTVLREIVKGSNP